jgi:simple sugar transport system permease protein
MLAYRGLARFLGEGRLMNLPMESKPVLFDVLNGDLTYLNRLWEPPANFRSSIFWFVGLTVVMTIVLTRSRLGNWAYASGGNPNAALAQGVNVKRIKLVSFMLSGLLAGFAGMLFFSHRLSVNPLTGHGSELLAVAASVIGGVRLTGGYGTIVGASMGMILMSMLEQGLVSMGISQEIFQAVTGLILILAMLANTVIGRQD